MYHFKLASNYQTVEFDVDELNIENLKLVADAINEVGKLVQSQSITTNTEKGVSKSSASKIENPPTPAQLSLCKKLNIDVKGKDKEQVRQMIKEAINK